MKFFSFCMLFLMSLPLHYTQGQSIHEGYYRLSCQWLGEGFSLAAHADGQVRLAPSANREDQIWRISAFGDGYYRITNLWLGEQKALDVKNDGSENYTVQVVQAGNFSGQAWLFIPEADGFYRMTTQWQGKSKSLDVINDAKKDRLQLTTTGNYSGQFWQFQAVRPDKNTEQPPSPKNHSMQTQALAGFSVLTNPLYKNESATKEALALLETKLNGLAEVLSAAQLHKLQKVPIWIEYKRLDNSAAHYHPSAAWLEQNGYIAEMAKSIEICNARHFVDWSEQQPYMILHELAHAYHDLYLSSSEWTERIRNAYEKAKKSGKYEKVAHINGAKNQRHYALTNESEYFAELTETYLGKNDFYPFDRVGLREFDPVGFALMRDVWGK